MSDENVSTRTIIAVSNCSFNLEKIYNGLTLNESIISINSPWGKRGNCYNKNQCSSINAVILDVVVTLQKVLNVKLYTNGKFHITGARYEEQAQDLVLTVFKELTPDMYFVRKDIDGNIESTEDRGNKIIVYFKTVMKNVNADIGYYIDREKLSEYFRTQTDFITSFESSVGPGVSLKYKLIDDDEKLVPTIIIPCETEKDKQTFKYYLLGTTDISEIPNNVLKFGKRDKYHSFRIFRSGKVIFSSRGAEMKSVYDKFLKIVQDHKDEFIET
jgi:TATA-box binding protein (TBP) (component of TFIID and TFIIIB)